MPKKNNHKKEPAAVPSRPMTQEERLALYKGVGFIAALFGAAMLNAAGMHVDFKINGEDIRDIEKLQQMDITQRIQLAIKEERYEDAAKLKKIMDKLAQVKTGNKLK